MIGHHPIGKGEFELFALDISEKPTSIRTHMVSCQLCARRLAEARGWIALLSFLAPRQSPSADAKQRFLQRIRLADQGSVTLQSPSVSIKDREESVKHIVPESRAGIPEKELIAQILAGNREHFHELVGPYEHAIYITAFAVLRNSADAEEAAQETVLKALTHLNQLSDPAKFKGWLLQIATNEARLKRRSRHDALFESFDEMHGQNAEDGFMPRDFADWRDIPSETLERKEIRRALMNALYKLPVIYREIFVLRDVEDLSVIECCQILGVSEEVVKVRLHRARLRIREELAPVFKANWFSRVLPFRGKKSW